MPHELEINEGQASFASARVPAWHRLGTVTDDLMTAEQALNLANLAGWNVHTVPVDALAATGACLVCGRTVGDKHTTRCEYLASDTGNPERVDSKDRTVYRDDTTAAIPVPGGNATVRTNPVTGQVEALGTVGSAYTPVQNEELAEWLTALVDVSGAVFETAGSLRGGQDVFMTLKLPEGIKVGGVDPIDWYIAGMNSHVGRRMLTSITTGVRVVCANTEKAALANAHTRYAVRHTVGATARMQEAREALQLSWDYANAFQVEAEKMINAEMTRGKFDELIQQVWPEKFPDDERDKWREPTQQHWETLQDMFVSAETQEDIRGTVWAGYQSIVEYLDWEVPIIGQPENDPNRVRAARTLDGTYDDLKQTAWDKCLALV